MIHFALNVKELKNLGNNNVQLATDQAACRNSEEPFDVPSTCSKTSASSQFFYFPAVELEDRLTPRQRFN